MCVCLCRKDTVREEEGKKRDSYDSDKDISLKVLKLALFLSLSLYSHIIHTLQDEFFPDSKGRRENCIALHCIAV